VALFVKGPRNLHHVPRRYWQGSIPNIRLCHNPQSARFRTPSAAHGDRAAPLRQKAKLPATNVTLLPDQAQTPPRLRVTTTRAPTTPHPFARNCDHTAAAARHTPVPGPERARTPPSPSPLRDVGPMPVPQPPWDRPGMHRRLLTAGILSAVLVTATLSAAPSASAAGPGAPACPVFPADNVLGRIPSAPTPPSRGARRAPATATR
jgi:hypothetical protein